MKGKKKGEVLERIILASFDGRITILDLDLKEIKKIEKEGQNKIAVDNIAFNSDTQLLYCSEYGEKFIRIYELKNNYRCRRIKCNS